MAKEKKSFFEKLTGIKKVEEGEPEEFVGDQPLEQSAEDNYFAQMETQNQDYEIPGASQQQSAAPAEGYQAPVQPAEQAVSMDQQIEAEGQLTIDVYQSDDDVVIKSTIAGVKPEDLDVNINNDMVTIRGERKQEEEIDPENYYYQECYWGPFSRSVILPVEIIADKAEATMKNGILTLRLPKADTTKTRKIQVRGY